MSHPVASVAAIVRTVRRDAVRINCDDCEMQGSEHCDDCLVSALLHPPATELDIDPSLDPPLEALAGAGLIPVLRFTPRRAADGEAGVSESLRRDTG